MKRRLVTLAAAASMLLCITALCLWLVTIFGWGRWTALQGPTVSYIATLSKGQLCFQIASVSPDRQRPATFRWRWVGGRVFPAGASSRIGSVSDKSFWSRVGLIRTMERIPYSDGLLDRSPSVAISMQAFCRSFELPLWLIALIGAALPVRWAMSDPGQRANQSRIERCPHCNYDLRATPERCPECGAVPAATAAR